MAAKTGPKPKPTKLKLVEGVGKHRIAKNEPKPRPIAPSCPHWLSGRAKYEWKLIVKELEPLGLLTKIDRAALAGYCDSYARWADASESLQKDGMVFETINKAGARYVTISPYITIINQAIGQMRAFLTEFGMTPSSRTRVAVDTDKDGDGEDLLT